MLEQAIELSESTIDQPPAQPARQNDPPTISQEKRQVARTIAEQIRGEVQKACQATWRIAELLAHVRSERLHLTMGYESLHAWAKAEADLAQGTVSKILMSWDKVQKLPEPKRAEFMESVDPLRAYAVRELIDGKNGDKALELAKSPISKTEMRRQVAEIAPEQHVESEWRSILVPADVRALWDDVMNLGRYYACETNPTPAALVTWLATEMLQAEIDPKHLARLGDGARERILRGEVKCQLWQTEWQHERCSGWNAAMLDPHHVLPRSHGGHEGEIVLLCRQCHDSWQPRWRTLAENLGYEVPGDA